MPFDTPIRCRDLSVVPRQPLTLSVRMPDGGLLLPTAHVGDRVMDALAAFGLPVRHECRGDRHCATCRARIAGEWVSLLRPVGPEEHAILSAHGADDGVTRLLCDLELTPDLDGFEFELLWDALVPQTNWVAG